METYNKLNVFRYEDSEESVREANKSGRPSIFLAGPTVRGNQPHLTSWRFEAIELFKSKGFDGSLIVPEFSSKTESDKGKEWVPRWEYNGLKNCNCILFWIPRTRELIGLTTNWEHGFWMGKDIRKMVYGRPDDAFRIGYLDIMWHDVITDENEMAFDNLIIKDTIFNTLSDTIDAAIILSQKVTIG